MSIQTLQAFLSSIQLDQYYEAFLKAGVTDQDLSLLVQLNDQELAEFLSAVDMLPFHSIKLKRAMKGFKLIETNPPPSTTLVDNTVSTLTKEFIVNNSIIYGKKNNRPLTSYEEAINRASLQLALENPLLISKKGDLFDLAKKQLLQEGYRYKRGCSRSKLRLKCNKGQALRRSSSCSEESVADIQRQQHQQLLIKRQENAQRLSEQRLERLDQLTLQVEDALRARQAIEQQLSDGQRRDQLTQLAMEAEIIRHEETKIRLTKEISKLKAQERKHQWYKRRKLKRASSGQSTDEGFCSQPSCHEEDDEDDEEENKLHDTITYSNFSTTSPASSFQTYSCQEPIEDEPDLHSTHILSHHCHHQSAMSTHFICCSRESDVRASSISNYDR
ncbi:hypothetical protein A0J61_00698 [Choanephora cucurbitarum]|uniref:NAB co-repressor domain-containing protein n=1 Tax=Choanephora cucurbitarum TaxID=101091 RepID=A0A1C7NQ67_9FUNG|nr:hypothetical protein A0J61_00698 [Choanephora cucurbitarum]